MRKRKIQYYLLVTNQRGVQRDRGGEREHNTRTEGLHEVDNVLPCGGRVLRLGSGSVGCTNEGGRVKDQL